MKYVAAFCAFSFGCLAYAGWVLYDLYHGEFK